MMFDDLVQSVARRLVRFSKRRSRRNLHAWLEESIREFSANGQGLVINIGAGGEVAGWLDDLGVRATSIDIDPNRHPDLVADMEDLSALADASVSMAICIEVLEHVRHPHLAVRELNRVLQPGGVLVGSTPFLLGIHDAPADYFRYTSHGLRMLFADFELLQLRERNGYFDAVAVLLLRRFAVGTRGERTAALLLSPVLIALTYILELIGRVLHSTDGTTGYFFVYRKLEKTMHSEPDNVDADRPKAQDNGG
ncbi:class I SAM-dependent methyltransferase [Parasulfuritortus cantonensis]|nr:class I SAM-dependent methyltransferase [Parasulfuritortus cantonensis]